MLPSLVALSLVSGLPALKPLQPPLALFSQEVLVDSTLHSPQNGDAFLVYSGEQCPGRAVSIMQAMGAALTTVERVQAWFKDNPGAEAALFKKDTLAQAMKHASAGVPSAATPCKPWATNDWQLAPTDPGKLCDSKKPPPATERYFTVKGKASSAVLVRPAADPCKPRVSIALFDPKGKTRLLVHADFGGAMSATVVGDRCRVDFTYDPSVEAFKADWKACKG
jgi:hypothetical protein